ncbi:MAG TPA: PAS domain S-box protein [Candidatus Lokiarchaeia archaeon]|nr:PAS domain S-box protein [Candidatus Lokiarchaeia archaeon]
MPVVNQDTPLDAISDEIKKEKKVLQTILDTSPVGIIVFDREGKITYANERARRLLGLSQSEVGKRFYNDPQWNISTPEGLTFPEESLLFNQVQSTLKPIFDERRAIKEQSGLTYLLSINATPLFDDEGAFDGMVATIEDITKRMQAEKVKNDALIATKESERFLANIFASIQDGVSILDENLKILRVNPIMEEWYSYNMPLVGKKCYEAYHSRAEPCEVCPTLESLESGQAAYEVVPKRGPEGEIVGWLDLYSFPLFDVGTGKLKGVIEYVRDITAKKNAEDALLESEQKYRTLFDSNLVPAAIADANGRFLQINPAFTDISGYTPDDLATVSATTLYVKQEDRARILGILMDEGQVKHEECQLRGKDGREIWAAISMKLIDLNGEKRIVVFAVDTTEKHQAEIALKDLYEQTLQVSEMKTNLITFASHELKTPLTPIIGWVDFFQTRRAKGENLDMVITNEILDSLFQSTKRLERIINNFLDIDRIERGQLDLQIATQSVANLMRNAIENVASLSQNRHIEITNEMQDEFLAVDAVRIEEIFTNILTNAIKYSPENTVVKITSTTTPESFSVAIKDQGYGFIAEELRDVWRPFSTSYLRKQSLESMPGTGVGLYIAKALTEQHGGTIQIHSEGRDRGSAVIITLPFNPTT